MLSIEARRERARLFSVFKPLEEPPLPERRRGWEETEAALALPEDVRVDAVIAGGVPAMEEIGAFVAARFARRSVADLAAA